MNRFGVRSVLVLLPILIALSACGIGDPDNVVRVYSGRHYGEEATFERFFEETGIKVEFLFGSDAELRERIKAEGERTEADVYMTVDAGNLYLAAQEGVFRPLDSEVLDSAIPANLRDPDNLWFGLGVRARTIVYNPELVGPEELSTYEALADPRWEGRLCMRDSSNVYTQSLVASLIAHHGEGEARRIVRGWVDNDVNILGSDVLILETVAEGGCEVGIVNHYYLARELEEDLGFNVDLAWANQQDRGTHVNVSGAGVTANSDDPELGRRLIEWLATDGQSSFVGTSFELPANPVADSPALVDDAFGDDFLRDDLSATEYGSLNAQAIRLMDEAGYE